MVYCEISYDDFKPHTTVEVAGEFSDWKPIKLSLQEGTRYNVKIDDVKAGNKYMYKFIIDGTWQLAQDGRPEGMLFYFFN